MDSSSKPANQRVSAQGDVTGATKSQARFKKYRRERRKRKSMKERFCVHKSKLEEQLLGMRTEVEDWKMKADELQEEFTKLKHQVQHLRSAKTCTKATIYHSRPLKGDETVPSQCRRLLWDEVSGDRGVQLGKGVFGTCYAVDIGCQKVCLKKFRSGSKFKPFFYSEVRILSLLCHFNLPWLHGVCDQLDHSIILMSLHLYNGSNYESLTIHKALNSADSHQITPHNWKQILLGITSALVYLKSKSILHNDIKSDNILIEMLPMDYSTARSVLIDFNKACFEEDGVMYKLSSEERKKYAKHYPQVAPEIRCGTGKQTFASDIYSFGRVLQKISMELQICALTKLSSLCRNLNADKRPTASELNTFLANLFE